MPGARGFLRPARSAGARGPALLDAKDLLYIQQRLARPDTGLCARPAAAAAAASRSPALATSLRQRPGSDSLARAHGVRGYADSHAGGGDRWCAHQRPPVQTGGHWRAPLSHAGEHAQTGGLDTSWHETQVDPGDVPHTVLLACMEQVRVHARWARAFRLGVEAHSVRRGGVRSIPVDSRFSHTSRQDAAAQEELVVVIGIMLEETLLGHSDDRTGALGRPGVWQGTWRTCRNG